MIEFIEELLTRPSVLHEDVVARLPLSIRSSFTDAEQPEPILGAGSSIYYVDGQLVQNPNEVHTDEVTPLIENVNRYGGAL